MRSPTRVHNLGMSAASRFALRLRRRGIEWLSAALGAGTRHRPGPARERRRMPDSRLAECAL